MSQQGWFRLLCLLVFFGSMPSWAVAREPIASAEAFFDATVAPVLARRCLGCHNASDHKGELDLTSQASLLKGGASGPAAVPSDPAASLLWSRVTQDEMPPKHPLSPEEKEILRGWIAAGAVWGTDPIDAWRFSGDSRAGYDWWSLQPLDTGPVPTVQQADWPTNPIDQFVLAELEQHGLHPAAAAGKRILARRLAFDLWGLPPTPELVAEFLADESPQAYDRYVDKLLESPHYGERWARHWLDVARYGESQGFERDKVRTNSWQYRDWVIHALNDDLPYDEFMRRQLAGDVLHPDDPTSVIATGFLVAGPWDEVGQSQQSEAMKAVVRQDELEDLVGTTAQTFLGLTVHCARCHDHKFDPISQADYYRLVAALGCVRHGERESLSPGGQSALEAERSVLANRIQDLRTQLAQVESRARECILAGRAKQPPSAIVPTPIARWEFNDNLDDSIGQLHATAQGGARIVEGRLKLEDGSSFVTSVPLQRELAEKTLEAWVALPNLDQQGGGVIGVQTLDGGTFDSIVYGEREARRWLPGSNGYVRTQDVGGDPETAEPGQLIHVAIVYGLDRSITVYRNGRPYGHGYQAAEVKTFLPEQSQVVFGLRHAPPGGNRLLTGEIDRAQLYDRALTADEVAASYGIVSDTISEDALLLELSAQERQQRDALLLDQSQWEARLRLLAGGSVYAVNPSAPQTVHRLVRGDTRQPAEEIAPGAVGAVRGPNADFGLDSSASDAARRVKLVEWLSSSENPLPARVIANRIWQYHFGAGIVETPNDFGFNGTRPSHARLLDWLAGELRRHQYSLKALHRTIVRSSTYRQSSAFQASAAAQDASNRLLWRKSPQRLEAEEIRDAILSIAGELNPRVGGPGYQDYRTFTFNSQFYEPVDPEGFANQRRSIYRTWVRSGTNPLLDVLDCPDPSTLAPVRAVTTTPLQALALLNNSFVLRMAGKFAKRLERECPGDAPGQIDHAYVLAFARHAQPDEVALGLPFIAEHGLDAYCRVLFNSNEFLYVD